MRFAVCVHESRQAKTRGFQRRDLKFYRYFRLEDLILCFVWCLRYRSSLGRLLLLRCFRYHLLLLTQLDKFLSSLLHFELETDLLKQKLHDLELEHLASSVFISVPGDRKQAFEQLFAKGKTRLFANLAMLLVQLLLFSAGGVC